MRRAVAIAAVAAAVLAGGAVGAIFGAPAISGAQTGSEAPAPDAPAPDAPAPGERPGPRHGRFHHEDRSFEHPHPGFTTAAEVIGITPEELAQALREGQSVADVARSRNVEPQRVIDALVEQAREVITARVNGTGFDQR